MYIQAKHDVIDARYPCSAQDAVTLAALQIQEEFGDIPEGKQGRIQKIYVINTLKNVSMSQLGVEGGTSRQRPRRIESPLHQSHYTVTV